jgi:hypothetical protein
MAVPGPGLPENYVHRRAPAGQTKAKLTTRAANWATDALQRFDTSVSALAH